MGRRFLRNITVLFGLAIICLSVSSGERQAMIYGSLFGFTFVVYGARDTALAKRFFPRWLSDIGSNRRK